MYKTETKSRDIEWYNQKYESDRYICAPWQRPDCWTLVWKQCLILSIMSGIDIPKIYIGQLKNSDIEAIIDGGHRTRAINDFINNKFSVKISGVEVLFNKKLEQSTRNTRVLTDEENKQFLRFELNVTTYINITENQCRDIFNILQNAQPMSVPDVINSHQSDLVDYLRHLSNEFKIGGISLKDSILKNKILTKVENNELLEQLASWFTIINPILIGDDDVDKEVAMKYLEKGKTRKSKCLTYIKNYKIMVSDTVKSDFEKHLIYLINFSIIDKLKSSDINSLIYSKKWIPNFSDKKYEAIINEVIKYSKIKNESDKNLKKGKIDQGKKDLEKAKENDKAGIFEIWSKSRSSGGSNYSGMSNRKDIVEEHCCD